MSWGRTSSLWKEEFGVSCSFPSSLLYQNTSQRRFSRFAGLAGHTARLLRRPTIIGKSFPSSNPDRPKHKPRVKKEQQTRHTTHPIRPVDSSNGFHECWLGRCLCGRRKKKKKKGLGGLPARHPPLSRSRASPTCLPNLPYPAYVTCLWI